MSLEPQGNIVYIQILRKFDTLKTRPQLLTYQVFMQFENFRKILFLHFKLRLTLLHVLRFVLNSNANFCVEKCFTYMLFKLAILLYLFIMTMFQHTC